MGCCDELLGRWALGLRDVLVGIEALGTRLDCGRCCLCEPSDVEFAVRWELLRAIGADGAVLDMVTAMSSPYKRRQACDAPSSCGYIRCSCDYDRQDVRQKAPMMAKADRRAVEMEAAG
jgi:hypothetical protein